MRRLFIFTFFLFSVTVFADVQPIDNGKFMALTKVVILKPLLYSGLPIAPTVKIFKNNQ